MQAYSDLHIRATSQFSVGWTGSSQVHVSIYTVQSVCIEQEETNPIVLLGKAKWRVLEKSFEPFKQAEFLWTPRDLRKLWLHDLAVSALGGKPLAGARKLTNPSTGNQFHRLFLLPDCGNGNFVGGIRFWVNHAGGSTIDFSSRIRVESYDPEAEISLRLQVKELQESLEQLDLATVTQEIDLKALWTGALDCTNEVKENSVLFEDKN